MRQTKTKPAVVGIAGRSGSGKTTLARLVAGRLGGLYVHFDNYYRDLAHLTLEERKRLNYDDPAQLEGELLVAQMAALGRGERIEQPVYDFAAHTRVPGLVEPLQARELLVVEGIFALHFDELLPLYGLRVFVETPVELCFARRLVRDTVERGRTAESVRAQWARTVEPSAQRWVAPTAGRADLVVSGAGDLQLELETVLAEMARRGLAGALEVHDRQA